MLLLLSVDVLGFADTKVHPDFASSPRTAVEVSPQQNCKVAALLLELVLPSPLILAAEAVI